MFKKILFLLFATTVLSVLLTCSGLDTYSTAGSEVVEQFDPHLTRFGDNFHPVFFDSALVVEARSIPETGRIGFGVHSGILTTGKSNGLSVAGSVAFTLTSQFAKNMAGARSVDSISYLLRMPLDSARYASFDTSRHFGLFATTDSKRLYVSAANPGDSICLLSNSSVDSASAVYRGTSTLKALNDSIVAYIALVNCAAPNNDTSKCGTHAPVSIGMLGTLIGTGDSLSYFVNSPAMLIHFTDASKTPRIDTLYGTSLSIVQESDSLIAARKALPVSVEGARRTALFKLDFSQFWDTLAMSGFPEVLTASIKCSIANADSLLSTDSLLIMLDTLLTDGNVLSAGFSNAISLGYSKIFSSDSGFTMHDISRKVQSFAKTRPQYLYLYLQLLTLDPLNPKEILWKKPSIKAVFTTIR